MPQSQAAEELLNAAPFDAASASARSGGRSGGGPRPLDDLLARGRLQLRELSASGAEATKAFEQATSSRCDLERQLQEWRKDSDAKKRKGNTGLLIPPRMSLDRLEEHRDRGDSSLGPQALAPARSSSAGGIGGLGGSFRGLASAASVPSLPTAEPLTPSRPLRRPASPPSAAMGDPLGFSAASASRASDRSGASGGGGAPSSAGHEEVAALRRYLATVQREVADRDRQLQELDAQEAFMARDLGGGSGAEPAIDVEVDVEEELRREEEQVQQLEAALAEADLRIRESEEQLRLDEAPARDRAGLSRGASPCAATRGSEAPSLASTAPTGPPSAEQVWQERARALEKEIRCEAAQATELQDRIHWLRGQLRRQPHSQDERIVAIRQLFKQIGDRLEHLNDHVEAPGERAMFSGAPAQPLLC